MAGYHSDDSGGCLLEGELDTGLAGLPPEHCVAESTPCMFEAEGVCYSHNANEHGELAVEDLWLLSKEAC